jgi:dTMP kinase
MRGKFITFEGGEGCGKSTQVELLKEYLDDIGIDSVVCREPGGVGISERIREIILDPKSSGMDSMTELFLFLASRRQIVKEYILPRLKEGKWVVCDRFMDSSVVYQGICRGLGISLVEGLNRVVLEGLEPDITIFLDIRVEEGLERVRSRGKFDRLDRESMEFHSKVREGFIDLSNKYPNRIKKVDASGSKMLVNTRVIFDIMVNIFGI